jgi:ankyrin repeat protein
MSETREALPRGVAKRTALRPSIRRTSQLLLLIAVLACCLGARRVQGPIWGTVEASDGTAVQDIVVRLRCASYLLHGAGPSDLETRIVTSGERFRFLWAWGGLAPVGCSVRIYHPLYITTYVQIGENFANDLGVIRLTSWDDFLAAGPTDPPMHSSYPWPAMEIQQHLSHIHYYHVNQHREKLRQRLARYVPNLQAIFERAIRMLPTSWHDDSSWNRDVRKHLRQIEEAVGWERPAEQIELAEAAAVGDEARVRALLIAGTDPDAWGADGAAPIHRAAQAGHSEVVRVLLNAGADIDRQREGAGDTPLLDAIQSHHDETTLLLIERGADVTLAAWRGSALQNAANGSASLLIVQALIARGAIENAREAKHVVGPLHTASRRGNVAILNELLDAGVPPDTTLGPPGYTALMVACKTGKPRTARLLLQAGANPHATTDDGNTPLSLALEGEHAEVVQVLREMSVQE